MAHPTVRKTQATSRPNAPGTNVGLGAGCMVLTLQGALPVEHLEPGDRIITRDGARRLARLARTLYRGPVVSVAESSLGHGRPESQMIVGCDQAILLRDWRSRVIYGAEEVLVPAQRLVDGEFLRLADTARPIWMFSLMFENPAVFMAGGLELASATLQMPVRLHS